MTCLVPYGCCVSVPSLMRYYVLSIVRGQSLCCLAFLHLTADINQRMMEDCSILLFDMESGLKSVLATHQTLWVRENKCVGKVLMWVSMSHYLCPTRLFPLSRKRSCIIPFFSLHLCWQLRNGLSERNSAQTQSPFKWKETKLSLVFLFWRTYALFLRKTTTTTKKTLSTSLELKQPWYPINSKALGRKAVALDTESLDALSGFTMICYVTLGKLDFLSVCHLQNVDEDTCSEK